MSKEGQQYLHSLFIYCPLTGIIQWKVSRGRVAKGASAMGVLHTGYYNLTIDSKRYKTHRVIWYYMTGDWPENDIDHIDGVRHNNKWNNLRDVSRHENQCNRVCHRLGKNPGTSYDKIYNKWIATGRRNKEGKQPHLGRFDTEQEARSAYLKYMEGATQ